MDDGAGPFSSSSQESRRQDLSSSTFWSPCDFLPTVPGPRQRSKIFRLFLRPLFSRAERRMFFFLSVRRDRDSQPPPLQNFGLIPISEMGRCFFSSRSTFRSVGNIGQLRIPPPLTCVSFFSLRLHEGNFTRQFVETIPGFFHHRFSLFALPSSSSESRWRFSSFLLSTGLSPGQPITKAQGDIPPSLETWISNAIEWGPLFPSPPSSRNRDSAFLACGHECNTIGSPSF